MPVMLGGPTARKQRVTGDIVSSYQYVNGEAAMVLFPLRKKPGGGAFIICDSAAWQYTDERYLLAQAMKAAQVMGMDLTRHTVYRIAGIIIDGLEDLIRMPPEPQLGDRKKIVGEIDITANGRTVTHEVTE